MRTSRLFMVLAGIVCCATLVAKGFGPPTRPAGGLALPSYFIPNEPAKPGGKGVVGNPEVVAFVRNANGKVLFTANGAFFGIPVGPQSEPVKQAMSKSRLIGDGHQARRLAVMKIGFDSPTKSSVMPRLMDRTEAVANFLIGPKSQWRTGLPMYRTLMYDNCWPKADLMFLGDQQHLEFRVMLRPGANPSDVVLSTGAEKIQLMENGSLSCQLAGGVLRTSAPVAWQILDGKRVPVTVQYRILSGGRFGFELGSYDPAHTVTIDPTIEWASFLGTDSEGDSMATGVASPQTGVYKGYVYVTGVTSSPYFQPRVGTYDEDFNGGSYDAVVTMLGSVSGYAMYSTFLGGNDTDIATAIEVDSSGTAYITGHTDSQDFPTTAGAFRTSLSGTGGDAFVCVLSDDGRELLYSSLLGGTNADTGNDIAVDGNRILVAGVTSSDDFPKVIDPNIVTHMAFIGFDTTYNGNDDGFVASFSMDLAGLNFTTYLGGVMNDEATSITVNTDGDIFVGGNTYSSGFPTTANAYQSSIGGYQDGFAVSLSTDGRSMKYGSFLGGNGSDAVSGIASNPSGVNPWEIFVAGSTTSTNFPTTPGVIGPSLQGDQDGFISNMSTGGGLAYSTYVGGSGSDAIFGLDYGAGDEFLITGVTTSSDFPTTAGALSTTLGGSMDGFVSWISTFLSQVDYSTYLGGSGNDYGTAVCKTYDQPLQVAVAGVSFSTNYPVTEGSWSTIKGGNACGVVTKLPYHLDDLTFSTYFSMLDVRDNGNEIAVDRYGQPFVTGGTRSAAFPTTPGVVDTTGEKNGDAFVAKFFAGGSGVQFVTYLGGSGVDTSYDIVLDEQTGTHAYPIITGRTDSSDFPVSGESWGATLHGTEWDAFVTKLAPDGTSLVFSGYLGGSDREIAFGLTIDDTGNVFVVGTTESDTFPFTANALEPTIHGVWDGFLTKLSADGSTLLYSTFFGGSGEEVIRVVRLDSSGGLLLAGETSSDDFPVQNALEPTYQGGGQDAILARLTPGEYALDFSTYLGGSGWDEAYALAINSAGEYYVAGISGSTDFPVPEDGWDHTEEGDYDGFILRVPPSGASILSGTFLGGDDEDYVMDMVINSDGHVIVAGTTESTTFPFTTNAMDSTRNGMSDGFISQFYPDLRALAYSTLLGGSNQDWLDGLAQDPRGTLYVAGTTDSPDFPVTAGAWDTTNESGADVFVAKLNWAAYTIQASAEDGGEISPHGAIPVPIGGMKTFQIYPHEGYRIKDVEVDGVSEAVDTHYTFTNVSADHTIVAYFEADTNHPTVDAFEVDPRSGDAPLTVQCTVEASPGAGRTLWQYVWHITRITGFPGANPTTIVVTTEPTLLYTLYQTGTYQIYVTVLDDMAAAGGAPYSITVNVSSPAPLPQPLNPPSTKGKASGALLPTMAVNPGDDPATVTLVAMDENQLEVATSDVIVPGKGSAGISVEAFEGLTYANIDAVSDSGLLFFTKLADGAARMTAYLNQSQQNELYLTHIAESTDYWNTTAFLANQQVKPVNAVLSGTAYPLSQERTLTVDLENYLPSPVTPDSSWGEFSGPSNPFTGPATLSGYEMFVKEGSDGAATELIHRASYTLYIPHIPDNTDIFWTGFAFVNPNTDDATVDFNFYNDDGLFVGHTTLTIPAGEKLKGLMTDLFPDVAGSADWALVSARKPITGIEIFGTYNAGICGLTLPDGATTSGIFPDVWTGGENWTGFTLTNMGGFTANVLIQLYDRNGVLKDQRTEAIPTLNRFKAVVADYFPDSELAQGDTVRFISDQPLTALEVSGDLDRTVMTALTAAVAQQ